MKTTTQIAKCLKYLGHTTLCDVLFGLFMSSWFIARHVFYLMVCFSAWGTKTIIPHGCFRGTGPASNLTGPFEAPAGRAYLLEPFISNDGLLCFEDSVRHGFIYVLGFLQVITIVWFGMIVRVAIRVLKGDGADDVRSDGEEEDEEDEEEEDDEEDGEPVEEEVGVEDLDLKGWQRRSGVKRQASSSTGVSLPGHSDRKELLGRIGWEKQVD